MTHVLLAEDDPAIAEPLARALTREGYNVVVQGTGQGAIDSASGADIVVLDLGLPDMDGLDVAREIRHKGLTTPVLVLTARADEVDLVVGLDAGADDYVTKPFRLAEPSPGSGRSCAARTASRSTRRSSPRRTSASTSPRTGRSRASASST